MGQVGKVSPAALLAVAVFAGGRAGAEPARDLGLGRIKVSFSASHIVLGVQDRLEVRVEGPAQAKELRLTTNVGAIEGARQLGPGRWRATYRAPSAFFPQVAIVAAQARIGDSGASVRPVTGWAALPLWGRGEAEVRTQRRAQVTVRIGERTYGPVRADQKGRATVKVIVPPGVEHGWDGKRKVPLTLPPMKRLHALAWPPQVEGVDPPPLTVLILAVAADGLPLAASHAPPRLTPGGGAAEPIAPGVWRAALQIPAGKPAKLTATASLPGDSVSSATVPLQRTAGPPAKLKLEAPATTDDDAAVTVAIEVVDGLGTPVDTREPLTPQAPIGRFGEVRRTGTGAYELRWKPPRWSSRERVTLRVSTAGVSGEATVKLGYPSNAWRRRLRPPWFWTAVGVSSAVLISAVVTRAIALDKSSEYKDPATSIERRRELKDVGEPLTTYSSVAIGVSAAAVVGTAVIYYFTDFDAEKGGRLGAVEPTAGGAVATFRF